MTVCVGEDGFVGEVVGAGELSGVEGGITGWCGTTGPVVLPPVRPVVTKVPIIIHGPGPDPLPPSVN
jgi:hypothetical protein